MARTHSFLGDNRSVSEVVGVSLLIGIVILGVAVILLTGLSQVDGSQDDIETSQAEQALTELDAEALRVATGSTSSQRIDLGLRGNSGTLDVEPESGNITVEYRDTFQDADPVTLLNETSLGTLVYENGDTTVGYQGGGVWRRDGDSSVMVSPPEISYDGNTLSMSVITTERGGSVHSDLQLSSAGPSEQKFPNSSVDNQNLTNKVSSGTLWITIESRYYQAWGQFFKQETEADVFIGEPEDGVVTVIFFGSDFSVSQDAGIIATSGPGEVRIEGSGSYVDSYNSANGSYSISETSDGVVKSAGNIDLFGGATIEGDVESERAIKLDGNSEITGDACADEVEGEDQVLGDTDCEANVPPIPPVNRIVEANVDRLAAENNNNDTASIQDQNLDLGGGSTVSLDPGEYYLEDIDLSSGETLILNASAGEITLAVENFVRLEDSKITIKGDPNDSAVKLYLGSSESSGETLPDTGQGGGGGGGGIPADHFYATGDSHVEIANDSSKRFQVIAPSYFTGGIVKGGSDRPQVRGIIFAPTLADGPSQFAVRQAELFGMVVAGNLTADNKAEVHFDRGILDFTLPFPDGSLLDFLHVTRHDIEVENS